MTTSAAYHDVMPETVRRRLMRMTDTTALYVRARPDRIAVHKHVDYSFQFELKTNTGTYHNMAIEAMPLAQYRSAAELGATIMYIYRDPGRNIEGGFWVTDDLPIQRIMVPRRWDGLRHYLNVAYPGMRLDPLASTAGSGDPFVVVPEARLSTLLFDWRKEIEMQLAYASAA